MSGTANDALNVARHWLGYVEEPVNRTIFGSWYGLDGNPWCAMFVSFCTYTSGTPCPASTPKGFAYCPSGIDWFRNGHEWHDAPAIGDLVFYDWNGDGVSDHVGIVEEIVAGGVIAIEGNENNAVERVTRTANIMGYGRPHYSVAPGTPAPPPSNAGVPPRWPGRYLTLTTPYTQGGDVKVVQTRLNVHGAGLATDGVFGPLTHNAVETFQRAHGLQVDGIVGPITWDALWR